MLKFLLKKKDLIYVKSYNLDNKMIRYTINKNYKNIDNSKPFYSDSAVAHITLLKIEVVKNF